MAGSGGINQPLIRGMGKCVLPSQVSQQFYPYPISPVSLNTGMQTLDTQDGSWSTRRALGV